MARVRTQVRTHKCSDYLQYVVIFGRPFWSCRKCGKDFPA